MPDPLVSKRHQSSTSSNDSVIKSSTNPLEKDSSAWKQASYATIREAVRMAVALVLDYSYKNQGGYKVNPTERRRFEFFSKQESSHNKSRHGLPMKQNIAIERYEKNQSEAQIIFLERRERLLKMLTRRGDQISSVYVSKMYPSTILNHTNNAQSPTLNDTTTTIAQDDYRPTMESTKRIKDETLLNTSVNTDNLECKVEENINSSSSGNGSDLRGGYSPPFTIQRVAEVLLMPERYYTQTHKLCNALEKLLLVTSPNTAFEIFYGDQMVQSRIEERDLSVSADERSRANSISEQRQRRLRRRTYSDASEPLSPENSDDEGYANKVNNTGLAPETDLLDSSKISGDGDLNHENKLFPPSTSEIGSNGMLFQMINNGSSVSNMNEKYISMQIESTAISGASRQMMEALTPSSFGAAPLSQMVSHDVNVSSMAGVSDGMRHHLKETESENFRNAQENFHTSVMFNQHAVARPPSPILFSPSSLATHNLSPMIHEHHRANPVLQSNHTAILGGHTNEIGSGNTVQVEILIDPSSSSSHGVSTSAMGTTLAAVAGSDIADLDGEQGRSSASNSDIDSESDDVSLDDSASDRSDGSDSGSSMAYHEPFNAARVMALNRLQQQQQRREHFLHNRALATMPSYQQHDAYRPPPDLEYQSGDSLDSMIAEDSGGSDSSSSDVND
uniref:Uncharacterized protein n=1 Tax=Eucampia antarctica TaxID=49252 RepID=A0A7S2RLB9_9STRA